MKFRLFGEFFPKVSEISLGLSQLKESKNRKHYAFKTEEEVLNIIKYAIKKKINFFDTSDDYGETEKILGKLPLRYKKKIIICTKAGRKLNSERSFKKKYLETQLDKSLKNLKTEQVDLFMLKKPQYSDIEKEDLIHFLGKLKKKGKIRASGIVVGNSDNFRKLIRCPEIDCFSILFNLINIEEIEFIKKAKNENKNIIIRSPLNSGLLNGKINSETQFNSLDERSNFFSGRDFFLKLEKIDRIKKLMKISNKNLLKFSLDFILTNQDIATVMIGCSSLKQLKEILSYRDRTKYLNLKTYKKTLSVVNEISKDYNLKNQIL